MSDATLELTDKNFEQTLAKSGILIIDFWATWCRPCVNFAPIFEAAAGNHKDITFAKVNTEEQEALASAFEIQAIPTLAVFRDGILIGQNQGALPAPALEEVIKQVRDLNMDDVKKEIAARTAADKKPEAGEVKADAAAPAKAN